MTLELVVLPNPAVGFQAKPPRRWHPWWMYCTVRNDSEEPILVYGGRHESETTTIPTSLFLLPAGRRTPHFWDCKGVLIPMDRDSCFLKPERFPPRPQARFEAFQTFVIDFAEAGCSNLSTF